MDYKNKKVVSQQEPDTEGIMSDDELESVAGGFPNIPGGNKIDPGVIDDLL